MVKIFKQLIIHYINEPCYLLLYAQDDYLCYILIFLLKRYIFANFTNIIITVVSRYSVNESSECFV